MVNTMQQEPVDMQALAELREIMGDDFNQLISVFITDSEKRLSDLHAAINTHNAAQVRAVAHSFKGSALNLSASGLTQLCRMLETMGREEKLEGAAEVLVRIEAEFARVQQYLLA